MMFYNNIVKNFRKIEQVEHVENLAQSYLSYKFLHHLASFLLWEKVKIFDFLKNQWLELNFLYIEKTMGKSENIWFLKTND